MDLLKLRAVLGLDTSEYEKGLDNAKGKLSGVGGAIKSGVASMAKISVAGIATATTAVGALTKASLDGYGNYQQMVGGVQKLYGNMGASLEDYAKSVGKSTSEVQSEWQALEDAQNIVLENAKNAYKTAGMSANQYMETATSFSASLINSLGGDTKKAADQTDVAVRAISDNWNTFGGDMGMIEHAFQGFAKQNYTMLDNLKLGYGGTKAEMGRLVDDANEYAKSIGMAGNLSMSSFSDIVTAIDLIQQKQHIAGTTSKEAASTIEGSIGSVKAAWDNLVTGFSDPKADVSQLMENVAVSSAAAVQNLVPTFTQALNGIGQAIVEIVPQVMEGLPKALDTIAIPLVKTGTSFVITIARGMADALPKVVDSGVKLIGNLSDGIDKGLPKFLEQVLPMVEKFTAGLRENAGKLVDAGLNLIVKLAQGLANSLPVLIEHIPQIIINIANIINDNAPKIIVAGIKIIGYLVVGLIKAIPTIIANIPKIAEAIFAVWSAVNWVSLGTKTINFIKQGFTTLKNELPNALKSIGQKAVDFFRYISWQNAGQGAINLIVTGIKSFGKLVWIALRSIGKTGIQVVKNINWMSVGKFIVQGIAKGITAVPGIIANALLRVVKFGYEKVKNFLGIRSPSKLFRDEIGVNIGKAIPLGIEDMLPTISRAMDEVADRLSVPSIEPFSMSTSNGYIPDTADGVLGAMESLQVQDIGSEESPRNVTVVLELNRTELARTVFNLYNSENQRHGVELAGGYA